MFTKLQFLLRPSAFYCLVVVLIGGYMLLQLLPSSPNYLTIIPSNCCFVHGGRQDVASNSGIVNGLARALGAGASEWSRLPAML
ncbi:hypothetical protein ACP70R_028621 [Stipagrostis hirtigluma subsp. patula]